MARVLTEWLAALAVRLAIPRDLRAPELLAILKRYEQRAMIDRDLLTRELALVAVHGGGIVISAVFLLVVGATADALHHDAVPVVLPLYAGAAAFCTAGLVLHLARYYRMRWIVFRRRELSAGASRGIWRSSDVDFIGQVIVAVLVGVSVALRV